MTGIVSPKDGKVLTCEKIPLSDKYDFDDILKIISSSVESYKKYNISKVGVTIPGLTDPLSGTWIYAPFSGISNIPVVKIIKERLNLPVYIENDVNACALGEKYFGICKEKSDYLWVTISNGIGGALFLNDRLYSGSGMCAGEIGHFIVEENSDRICGCGKAGCLEAVSSGRAIAKKYKSLSGKTLTGQELQASFLSGDKNAFISYREAGLYIGKALSYCINLLNIDTVILGGGVMNSFDIISPFINEGLEKYIFDNANKNVSILKSGLGYEAALISCAAICEEGVKNDRRNQ